MKEEENIQELLTKQLVMCQFACALSILREGGHFVCSLFDMYTPFLVGLIYLLYRCFERICIIKPVTSRPANSERWDMCVGICMCRCVCVCVCVCVCCVCVCVCVCVSYAYRIFGNIGCH